MDSTRKEAGKRTGYYEESVSRQMGVGERTRSLRGVIILSTAKRLEEKTNEQPISMVDAEVHLFTPLSTAGIDFHSSGRIPKARFFASPVQRV
jgi:hypothetical protein